MKSASILVILAACLPLCGQFQVNSPAASLKLEGASSGGVSAIDITFEAGERAGLEFTSTEIGRTFDLFFNLAPQIPAPPGIVIGSQLVNVDILGSGVFFLSGTGAGFPVPSPPAGFNRFIQLFSVPCTSPGKISLQSYAETPTLPEGLATSSAVTITCFSCAMPGPGATPITLGDDTFIRQFIQSRPLFYGGAYTECFINSNGSISFGAGDPNPPQSPASMITGPPRIAALWTDLDPSAGGTVSVQQTLTDFSVYFVQVPERGMSNQNSISIHLRHGIVGINHCAVDATAAIVGITPGNNRSTSPRANFDFSVSTQVVNTSEAIFEVFDAANPLDTVGQDLVFVLDPFNTGNPWLYL